MNECVTQIAVVSDAQAVASKQSDPDHCLSSEFVHKGLYVQTIDIHPSQNQFRHLFLSF